MVKLAKESTDESDAGECQQKLVVENSGRIDSRECDGHEEDNSQYDTDSYCHEEDNS